MIRKAVRSGVEIAASATGLNSLARRRARSKVAILAYHNVVPVSHAGCGDASLHLEFPRFIEQIERLARTHDIIDIDDVASASAGRRPRAVITFDDAYRGAVTLALPELIRRGLPAVMFVSPALLGAPATWWDELAEAGLLTDAVRDDALENLAGRGDAVRQRAFGQLPVPVLPATYGIVTMEELSEHCRGAIRVGSHTWAHEYLPALDHTELEDNLGRTRAWLGAYRGATTNWLALPYGGGSTPVGRAALAAGHAGVLSISGGLWDRSTGRAQVPRINVPAGLSLRGLELRTSGLKG